MEQVEVFCQGRAVGTLDWADTGLYRRFSARLDWVPEAGAAEIYRLWVLGAEGSFCLGVPVPEAGAWRLQTTLARRALGDLKPLEAQLRTGEADWQPWEPDSGLQCRREGGALLLRAAWTGGSCRLAPMFCLCTPEEGALCARLGPEDPIVIDEAAPAI